MTTDAIGGVWQYTADLSLALRPFGVETVLALLGPTPSAAQRRDLDASVTLVETGLELDWLAPDAAVVEAGGAPIAALAQRLGADLVHLNQPALAASLHLDLPVVATVHSCVATWWQAVHGGALPAAFAWRTALVSSGLRHCDTVVAPSLAFAETVRRTYALPTRPHVVPNGRRAPVAQAAIENSVFTAGRLWDKGKNVALLDRVASRLAQPFRAAGSTWGPHGERIALQHIEPLGSLGAAGVAASLATRPVFVSAALYEPFGLAVLEAATAGCALVLSDIATFRENWGGAATFVAPSDEDGFLAAIEALLADPHLREHRGSQARRRAADFTPARTAAGMHALYERALAEHKIGVLTVPA